MRQLTAALAPHVARFTCLTEYDEQWDNPVAFPPERPAITLARVIADAGRGQLHVAETDVPVATMCSGGIDSGLVTAYAREEQPGVVAYHAAIADQPEQDERRWAELVARRLAVELRRVEVTARSWRRDFVRTCAHIEAPMLHPSSVAMLQIAARAREDGIVVLLSGEGADELFGGYGFLHG